MTSFCDATEDNGATGASFGEVQAFASKDQLAQDVAEAQKAMKGVTPPDEIVDAWQTRKQYLVKLEASAQRPVARVGRRVLEGVQADHGLLVRRVRRLSG